MCYGASRVSSKLPEYIWMLQYTSVLLNGHKFPLLMKNIKNAACWLWLDKASENLALDLCHLPRLTLWGNEMKTPYVSSLRGLNYNWKNPMPLRRKLRVYLILS